MSNSGHHLIGFIGSRLDNGFKPERWSRWRPTVAMCQHEDLLIERVDLLVEKREQKLAEIVTADIASVSPETTVHLHRFDLRDPWDFEEVFSKLHDFASDYPFDTDNIDYLVNITTGTHVEQICLFLLTESRHLPGRLFQLSPPRQRKTGIGTYRMIDLDLSRYDDIAARFSQEAEQSLSFLKAGINTRNPAFNEMMKQIERVAISSQAPMLVTGPTGAGKTQLARRIYELKRQREQLQGRFVEVNCATLRGDQAMGTLFGHVKGAFTGAATSRDGLLLSANGGMLFLDEIGELGLDEQAMLLRAIEEKHFLPVGSDQEVSSNFQLIVGTNRSLQSSVAAGQFREDLLARINLWTFALPSLRDRKEDIAPNLEYEMDRFATETGRKVTFNREAQKQFLQFAISSEATWPGNFRDLNAAVTRMATLSANGRITKDVVDEELNRLQANWQPVDVEQGYDLSRWLGEDAIESLDLFDQRQLATVLEVCQQSKSLSDAGRKLFAVSRSAKKNPNDADRVRKYLARFGLSWSDLNN